LLDDHKELSERNVAQLIHLSLIAHENVKEIKTDKTDI